MSTYIRLLVAFGVSLLILGGPSLGSAQAVPEAQCGAAFCTYIPLAGRPMPQLKVVGSQFELVFKSNRPSSIIVIVENTGSVTLYDVAGSARLSIDGVEHTLMLRLEAPAIPVGHRGWMSGSLGSLQPPTQVAQVALLSFTITDYADAQGPATLGLTLLSSVIDCANASFVYTVRNDNPVRMGNLYISPRQLYTPPDSPIGVIVAPGEQVTLIRAMFIYDQIYTYCSGFYTPTVPMVYVQGQLLP
jgi:hypothetical protein